MQTIEILMVLIAYILGSIPFGLIVYRVFKGGDIRAVGSRNIGATNVARNAGYGLGLLTLILDILKGYLAIVMCYIVGIQADSFAISLAALAALMGHMFPVWLMFRGGKGIATGLGVFIGLAWHVAFMALAIFIISALLTRIVSLSSLAATLSFVILMFALGPWLNISFNLQIGALLAGVLIFIRHHENIGRLVTGKEKRFSAGGLKTPERRED